MHKACLFNGRMYRSCWVVVSLILGFSNLAQLFFSRIAPFLYTFLVLSWLWSEVLSSGVIHYPAYRFRIPLFTFWMSEILTWHEEILGLTSKQYKFQSLKETEKSNNCQTNNIIGLLDLRPDIVPRRSSSPREGISKMLFRPAESFETYSRIIVTSECCQR